jgi:hypothetical protein
MIFWPPPQVGWQGTVHLRDKGGSGPAQAIQRIEVKWKADVAVLCICPTGCEIRFGTRVFEDYKEDTWPIYNPTSLPTGIPVFATIAQGIGKVFAAGIKAVSGSMGVVAERETLNDMIQAINELETPAAPQDGRWEDDQSPCSK